MRYWSSAIRSSAATRRASKSSQGSSPREPGSPVAGGFAWAVIPPPSLHPGRPACPGRLYATPEAHLGDVREMPAVDALGGREQLGRQAGRGRQELEAEDPPVEEAEVERDHTREVAVVLEQKCRTEDIGGTGRTKGEVGDVGRRVVGEEHRTLCRSPRHTDTIGARAQGADSRLVVTVRR